MRALLLPSALALLVGVAGCTGSPTPNAGGTDDNSSMVLAQAVEPTSLNPLLGYGANGAAKVYDGLVAHSADLTLAPALAEQLPTPSADGLSWTATLREGVKFSDGSTFGPEDVVATYRALLDPATGSTVRADFAGLQGVEQLDDRTVRFALEKPWAAFPHKLVLGILPSEALGVPLDQVKPIGTGPYQVVEHKRGDRLQLTANPEFRGGAPGVRELTVVFVPDDNTRAQRMQAGDFDGAELPPRLASLAGSASGMRLITHRSADLRAVTLPTGNQVTGDPAIRAALNAAVDREALVQSLLGGKGAAASTPVPETTPEYVDTTASIRHDKARAEQLLDQAGWAKGADGMRSRDGAPARFTLMYPIGDVVRNDLATGFAADARAVGVDVQLAGLAWDSIRPRLGQDALLWAGGSPFDPDLALTAALRTGNPWGYSDPVVDAALDTGRAQLDPAQRATAYRQFQRAYVEDPAMVVLALVQHTYVVRDNWNGYQQVVDTAGAGPLSWGPWWNIEKWGSK
ncbi:MULTISPECIES: ABC transporter substrate-binding protein [Actinosynnema]|uniref:ABC transporter substrate-binding protein n=1 Tax=Actinosynnema TaxID=40566 RepID=UPI0020A39FED|nr:ABC transporter substrate-binding protein [Actinosynnema pretiosum]MCP2094164.1 peptide/nickel transport system substrate-binding protein [Actinosynnema pretiosum]